MNGTEAIEKRRSYEALEKLRRRLGKMAGNGYIAAEDYLWLSATIDRMKIVIDEGVVTDEAE